MRGKSIALGDRGDRSIVPLPGDRRVGVLGGCLEVMDVVVAEVSASGGDRQNDGYTRDRLAATIIAAPAGIGRPAERA
jgi:hypothetical protein